MASHHVSWHHITGFDVTSCELPSHHVMWPHNMRHDVTTCDVTSHHVSWRHTTWDEVTLCGMTSLFVEWRHPIWYAVTASAITSRVLRLYFTSGTVLVLKVVYSVWTFSWSTNWQCFALDILFFFIPFVEISKHVEILKRRIHSDESLLNGIQNIHYL